MSREELIEQICPCENAIKCHSDEGCDINCSMCREELDEMLDEYDAEVRAEAFREVLAEMRKSPFARTYIENQLKEIKT